MDVFQRIKIAKQFYSAITIVLFFLIIFFDASAQKFSTSSYGVNYISSAGSYRKTIKNDNNKKMYNLQQIIPGIMVDLRYASSQNFVRKPLYPVGVTSAFLRMLPAKALALVQLELNNQGFGLKVFDSYRPYSVTIKFWELVKDDRYVANPSKGSGHNRGLAIDLTIINLKTGTELDMGTGFDNFTDSAHHSFTQLPSTVLQNRNLLKDVMMKYGFQPLETEWWHYYWPNDRNYEVLDLTFSQLKRVD